MNELKKQTNINTGEKVYHRDPAWTKGLMSASQEVARYVKELVVAANKGKKKQTWMNGKQKWMENKHK